MMDLLGEIEDEIDEDDVELLAKVFRSQTFKHLLKVNWKRVHSLLLCFMNYLLLFSKTLKISCCLLLFQFFIL